MVLVRVSESLVLLVRHSRPDLGRHESLFSLAISSALPLLVLPRIVEEQEKRG